MNKNEVVSRMARYSNISRYEAALALNSLIKIVTNALEQNQQVHITGFGTFKIAEVSCDNRDQTKKRNKIELTSRNKHEFRAGWIMNRKVDPNVVKPFNQEIGLSNNNLAILLTIRNMVRSKSISALKQVENCKPIINALRCLPINSYSLRQWLVAGQFLTDYRIDATDKSGVVNQTLYMLSAASSRNLIQKPEC